MAFITLGTASQLTIKVPTQGTTSWASTMQTDTFLKIAQHDHTGSGNGSQLGTGSLQADAVTGAKVRLDNDEYLRGRNFADDGNINIIKIDTNDLIALGATVANFKIKNNTYIQGVDQVGTGSIDIVKVDGGDDLAFGADVSALVMKHNTYLQADNSGGTPTNLIKMDTNNEMALGTTVANLDLKANTYLTSNSVNLAKVDSQSRVDLMDGSIVVKGSATLTDNTSSATAVPNAPTASANETLWIFYKIVRNGLVQCGQLILDEDNSGLIEECYGDDCGVTFTEDAGVLDYTTTSTGNNATLTYTVFKL